MNRGQHHVVCVGIRIEIVMEMDTEIAHPTSNHTTDHLRNQGGPWEGDHIDGFVEKMKNAVVSIELLDFFCTDKKRVPQRS